MRRIASALIALLAVFQPVMADEAIHPYYRLRVDPASAVATAAGDGGGNTTTDAPVSNDLVVVPPDLVPIASPTIATPRMAVALHAGAAPLPNVPTASNGVPSYTYQLATGYTLPDGLSVDPSSGSVVGTTSTPVTTIIALQVSDLVGNTATSAPYPVTVLPGLATTTPPGIVTTPGKPVTGQPPVPSNVIGQVTWTLLSARKVAAMPGATRFASLDGLLRLLSPVSSAVADDGTGDQGMTVDPSTGAVSTDASQPGRYAVVERATDSSGATTDTGTVPVTVSDNLTASAPSGTSTHSDQTASSGAPTASGGSGQVTWAFAGGYSPPAGMTVDPTSGVVTAADVAPGSYTFDLQATDSSGETATTGDETFSVLAPLTTTTPPSIALHSDQTASTAVLSAGNAIGTPSWALTSGSLPGGASLDTGTGSVTFSGVATGDYTFGLTATDGTGETAPTGSFDVSVSAPLGLSGASSPAVHSDQVASAPAPSVTNPMGSVTFSLQGAPAGLTVDPGTGVVTATDVAAGSYQVTELVTDSSETASQAIAATFAAPLAIATPTDVTGPTGSPLSSPAPSVSNAIGAVGVTYAVSSGALPAGVTIDGTGAVSGTPTAAGSATVVETATDATGENVSTRAFRVVASLSPTIQAGTVTPTNGQAYSADLSQVMAAANLTNPQWAATALPPGLSLSQGGLLTGTPSAVGTTVSPVTVTNDDGYASTANLTVSVSVPPVIVATSKGFFVGVSHPAIPLASLMQATGLSGQAWSAPSLPDSMYLTPDGSLAGATNSLGTFVVPVSVLNANGGQATANLTIWSDPAFIAQSQAVFPVAGQSFSANVATVENLSTENQTPLPTGLAWSLLSGAVPDGLALASDGTLSGTPSASAIGIHPVSLTVLTLHGLTTSMNMSIDVESPVTAAMAYPLTASIDGGPATAANVTALFQGYQGNPVTGTVFTFNYAQVTEIDNRAVANDRLEVYRATDGWHDYYTTYPAPDAGSTFRVTAPSAVSVTAPMMTFNGASMPALQSILPVTLTLTSGKSSTSSLQSLMQARNTSGTQSWSVVQGGAFPQGLSMTSDGTVSGTPSSTGTTVVYVSMTDGRGYPTLPSAVTVNVVPPTPAIVAATIDGTHNSSTYAPPPALGQSYSANLATVMSATNASNATWSATSVPAGLQVSSSGTLSGTPTTAGTTTFPVTVSNANGSGTANLTVTVYAPPTLAATTVTGGTGSTASNSFNLASLMQPTNLSSPSWTASGLPPRMTLSSAGVLTGYAQTNGTTKITVTVTNSNGASASAVLTYVSDTPPSFSNNYATITATKGKASTGNVATILGAQGTVSGFTVKTSWYNSYAPPGITVDSGGNLGGAMTTTTQDEYTLVVTVTNPDGVSATAYMRVDTNGYTSNAG